MKIQIEDKALIEEQKKRISELELLEFTLKKTEEDLRLHQIELEMQNQELRLVQSNECVTKVWATKLPVFENVSNFVFVLPKISYSYPNPHFYLPHVNPTCFVLL